MLSRRKSKIIHCLIFQQSIIKSKSQHIYLMFWQVKYSSPNYCPMYEILFNVIFLYNINSLKLYNSIIPAFLMLIPLLHFQDNMKVWWCKERGINIMKIGNLYKGFYHCGRDIMKGNIILNIDMLLHN